MANLLISSLFLSLLLSALFSLSSAACTDDILSRGRAFKRCLDLDALDASVHWTHFPRNGTASFAFKAESDGWAAWGLNPTASGMVGTQAFIAQRGGASGTSFFTTSLTSKSIELAEGPISVSFSNFTAEDRDGKFIIYVTLTLPRNGTTFNHTWQTGPLNADGTPGVHSFRGDHDKSFGTLNLVAATNAAPAGAPRPSPAGAPRSSPPRGTPSSTPAGAPRPSPAGAPRSSPPRGTPSSTPPGGPPSSTPPGGAPSSTKGKNDVGRRAGFLSCFLVVVGTFLW